MRRGLSILLTMVLCLSLVACGGKSNEASGTDSDNTGKKTLTIALLPKTLRIPISLLAGLAKAAAKELSNDEYTIEICGIRTSL